MGWGGGGVRGVMATAAPIFCSSVSALPVTAAM
jgi:hypothetical protein